MGEPYQWVKIAASLAELAFNEEGLLELEVNGKAVCMSKINDSLHACTAKCPHAGAKLAQGYVDALGNIVCPLHRYKFSAANGRNVSGEGYYLKTFPVRQTGDGIYIGM
ncbi:MAG: Rieske 2Fe-2S protein [Ferruginibacter sp.]|nr:Rieske 2Fe-2S protein [Ferruginibacter sp.]